MDDLVADARTLARRCVDRPELANRWRHLQAVATRADRLAVTVDPTDRAVLISAAWLHDIGYGPDLIDTGLHALDGARYLQRRGYPDRIVALVAHHTGARFEAAERGLVRELAAFECEDSPVMDALVTADLTSGPDGQTMSLNARLDEILRRYPQASVVHRAILKARPALEDHVERTLTLLRTRDPFQRWCSTSRGVDLPARSATSRGGTMTETRPSIVAAIIVDNGRVLMVRRRIAEGSPSWQFPAGETEPGESPFDTAARETREEVGLDVQPLLVIGERLHPATGRHMIYVSCSVAPGSSATVIDTEELAEMAWYDWPELQTNVPTGLYPLVATYLQNALR